MGLALPFVLLAVCGCGGRESGANAGAGTGSGHGSGTGSTAGSETASDNNDDSSTGSGSDASMDAQGPGSCATDSDCVQPAAQYCDPCFEGGVSCGRTACIDGTCQYEPPDCPGPVGNPCASKMCGDPCQQCSTLDGGCYPGTCDWLGACKTTVPVCSASAQTSCDVDAVGIGDCNHVLGWSWDGSKCVAVVGCDCRGSDCGDLLPDSDDCIAEFRFTCNGDSGTVTPPPDADVLANAADSDGHPSRPCVPTNASSPANGNFGAVCTTVFGWAWDGSKCIAIVGCTCEGSDCGGVLADRSACAAAYSDCSAQP
jgi:hypothetical protein